VSIQIKFNLSVEDKNRYQTIIDILKSSRYVDIIAAVDQSSIICSKKFPDWTNFISGLTYLHGVDGIQKATPLDPTEIQGWKKHWVIPLLISAAVNMVSLTLLVYGIRPNSTPFDYLVLTIVPTVLAFAASAVPKLEK
jgi:hypothetical protein